MLTWNKPMTSEQAAKYLLTGGFVAVELHNATTRERDGLREKALRKAEALRKIIAHTGTLPGAQNDLLLGLLASIKRIAEDSLYGGKNCTACGVDTHGNGNIKDGKLMCDSCSA